MSVINLQDIADDVKQEIVDKIDQIRQDVMGFEPYAIAGLAGAGGVMLLTLLLIIIILIMQGILISKVNTVQRFQRMSEEMPRMVPNGAVPNRFRSVSNVK